MGETRKLNWGLGLSRRAFLGLTGSLIPSLAPAPLRGALPSRAAPLDLHTGVNTPPLSDLRLSPRYRAKSPLDDIFRYIDPGSDEFISEKYAEEIEGIVGKWSALLTNSPSNVSEIGVFLAPSFQGCTLQPSQIQQLRSEPSLEAWRRHFSVLATLGHGPFMQELRAFFSTFNKLITAEFKVFAISVRDGSPLRLETQIRYDLVGSGPDFHREQRVGIWKLEWERSGEPRVVKWSAAEETRSRASAPVFVDISSRVMQRCPSFKRQLVPGTDYWRTVLDAAVGIVLGGNYGIAAGDIDNDGFDDLYVCQHQGLPNRLYRNRGDGTFEDVTETAGVGVLNGSPCALFADVDNDGYQDLLVVTHTGPLLFMNQGNGKFKRRPDAFRFATEPEGTFTTAAFADYDRDGWLDVYFCVYSYYQGIGQYAYPVPYYAAENGPPNFFFRNNRDGTFTDVTAASGLNQNNTRFSYGCGWSDYNDDGWPDLYVANDFGKKNLYRNNGDGTFTDIAVEAGVVNVGPGMSVTWLDYDNDGKQDLYVANMWEPPGLRVSVQENFLKGAPEQVRALFHQHAMGNALFHNEGSDKFRETTQEAGVDMGRWSWTTSAWDFDHDGYPDIYIPNGFISGPKTHDLQSFFWRQVVAKSPLEARSDQRYELGWTATHELTHSDGSWGGYARNVFFANNHDGTFSDVSGTVGMDFIEDGRSYSLADFDHDGRLEVFLRNRNGPQLRILRNNVRELGEAIAFRLRGKTSNRDAIGAMITVETARGRQVKVLQAGSGMFSQHTKEVFFGLGKDPGPVRVTVRWPGGPVSNVQQIENVTPGHRVEIEEGSKEFRAEPFARPILPSEAPAPVPQPLPTVFGTWLIEPQPALDFNLPDINGREYTLAAFRGRKLLLNFWNLESPACQKELRSFQWQQSRWTSQKLAVAAVHAPLNSAGDSEQAGEADKVRAFARENGISFPVLLASDDMASIYNLLFFYLFDRHRDIGFPTSFLLDEQGLIVKIYQGPVDSEEVSRDCGIIPRTKAELQARALPFPGTAYGIEFHLPHLSQGVAFIQRGYPEQAESFFQIAVRENPDSADAHYNLGTLYLQKQMWEAAREHLRRASELKPGNLVTLNNLGVLAAQRGDVDEALGYFQKVLQADPDFTFGLQNLGDLYRRQGKLSEAQQVLERALQTQPENPEVNYLLGLVSGQKGDNDQAREYLQRAVKLRPQYPDALNNLGVLYLRTRNVPEAIAAFQDCIRVAPDFDQPYLNLARVYIVLRNREEARKVLRQLLEQHPNHPMALKMVEQLTR